MDEIDEIDQSSTTTSVWSCETCWSANGVRHQAGPGGGSKSCTRPGCVSSSCSRPSVRTSTSASSNESQSGQGFRGGGEELPGNRESAGPDGPQTYKQAGSPGARRQDDECHEAGNRERAPTGQSESVFIHFLEVRYPTTRGRETKLGEALEEKRFEITSRKTAGASSQARDDRSSASRLPRFREGGAVRPREGCAGPSRR